MSSGVSVIIPAYNEGPRVANVVKASRMAPGISEILVVNDGSADDTAARARAAGARVINMPQNGGMGAAMARGFQESRGDVLLSLDADLSGLRPDHIWRMVHPVQSGWSAMTAGAIGTGIGSEIYDYLPMALAYRMAGQRAVTRAVAMDAIANGLATSRYGGDMVLDKVARTHGHVYVVRLDGVGHMPQTNKWGRSRLAINSEIAMNLLRHIL